MGTRVSLVAAAIVIALGSPATRVSRTLRIARRRAPGHSDRRRTFPHHPFLTAAGGGNEHVVVVGGFFGGFVLSAIKRDLRVKDWGRMIEGHGGVLDRMDSVSFASPLFFHLTRYSFAA